MLQPTTDNIFATVEDLLRTKDARTMFQLSGDQNQQAGQRANLQFLLNLAAGEFESITYGYVGKIVPARIPSSGQITLTGVPADNRTITISDGLTSATLTFLSGGVLLTQVNTASADPATIAGLLGAALPLNKLGIAWENVGIVLGLQNLAAGVLGNVAIVTNAQEVAAVGMAGGGYQVPFICKKWVCAKAAEGAFARRSDMPEQIRQAVAWADKWADDFINRRVSIPGVGRAMPTLYQGPPIGVIAACQQWDWDWATWPGLTPNWA